MGTVLARDMLECLRAQVADHSPAECGPATCWPHRLIAEAERAENKPGARLRAMREEKGLTLSAVSTRAGIDRGFLSRVENGHQQPSLGMLARLASVLELVELAQAVTVIRRYQGDDYGWRSRRRKPDTDAELQAFLARAQDRNRAALDALAEHDRDGIPPASDPDGGRRGD